MLIESLGLMVFVFTVDGCFEVWVAAAQACAWGSGQLLFALGG